METLRLSGTVFLFLVKTKVIYKLQSQIIQCLIVIIGDSNQLFKFEGPLNGGATDCGVENQYFSHFTLSYCSGHHWVHHDLLLYYTQQLLDTKEYSHKFGLGLSITLQRRNSTFHTH